MVNEVCVVCDDHKLEVALLGSIRNDVREGFGKPAFVVLVKVRGRLVQGEDATCLVEETNDWRA